MVFLLTPQLLIPALIVFPLPERPFPTGKTAIHPSNLAQKSPSMMKQPPLQARPWAADGTCSPISAPCSTLAILLCSSPAPCRLRSRKDKMLGFFIIYQQKAELATDIPYVSIAARNPLWERGRVGKGCVSGHPGRGKLQLPDSLESLGVPD